MKTKRLKTLVEILKEYNSELEADAQGRIKPKQEEKWLYPIDHMMLGQLVEETVNVPGWLVK